MALKAQPVEHPAWMSLEGPLAGMIDRMMEQCRQAGRFTAHDVAIGTDIKQVYVKSTSFEDAVAKEREHFLALCHNPFTQARIRHMIEHNKPLKN